MKNSLEIVTKKSKKELIFLFIILNFISIFLSSLVFGSDILLNIQKKTNGIIDPNLIIFSFFNLILIAVLLIFGNKFSAHQLGLVRFKQGLYAFFLIWVLSQVLIFVINIAFGFNLVIDIIWSRWGASYVLGYLFAMIFGTALYEEIAFRGYLFPQLYLVNEKRNQVLFAIAISSLIFSLWHIPSLVNILKLPLQDFLIRLLMLFVVGIILCIAYIRTGNLFVVIVIHALNNAPTPILNSILNPSLIVQIISILFLIIWPLLFGNSKLREWYRITSNSQMPQ